MYSVPISPSRSPHPYAGGPSLPSPLSGTFCGPGERCGPVGSGPIAGRAAEAATASGKPWGSARLAAGSVPFPAHGLCPSPKACQYLWDVVGGPSTPLGVSLASLPPEGLGTEESPPSHGPQKCLIPAPAQPALPGSSDTDVLVPWLQGWAARFPQGLVSDSFQIYFPVTQRELRTYMFNLNFTQSRTQLLGRKDPSICCIWTRG